MKRSLFYIAAAIALTYLTRELEYAGIRMNKQGQFRKYDQMFLEKNDCDILILGSSRAESHFCPDIIQNATGMRTFNGGLLGATLPFIASAYRAYLEHSPAPKYVVLNIDYHMFIANDDSIRHFPSYFPYLSNKSLYEGFAARDHRFPFFRYIPFYSLPYCGTKYLNNSIRGYLDKPGKYDTTFHNGYAPIPYNSIGDLDTTRIKAYAPWLKDASWKALDQLLDNCQRSKTQVFIVYSPLYHRLSEAITNEDSIITYINHIAATKNARVFNYLKTPECYDKKFFSDLDHLNREGAAIFSWQFALDLRQYFRH